MVKKMFSYEFLPQLNDFIVTKRLEKNSDGSRTSSKDKAIQTQVFDNTSHKIDTPTQDRKRVLFLNLPPAVNNSILVRQRASAKDSLAAASLSTAVSLPLMISGRSKCVVNLLENARQVEQPEQDDGRNQGARCCVVPENVTDSLIATSPAHPVNTISQNAQVIPNVPKNTALRAEQRRQNMVSVVRPVINTTTNHQINSLSASSSSSSSSSVSFYPSATKQIGTTLDDSISEWQDNTASQKASIIEDFINLEQKVRSKVNVTLDRARNHNFYNSNLDDLYLLEQLNSNQHQNSNKRQNQLNEHQIKQQMILMKREEHELNKGIKKEHCFFIAKIEERRRNLQIIQSVWYQRDLKHAIEKLVDLYNEGLIFTCQDSNNGTKTSIVNRGQKQRENITLNSLNTSLVVDVIGILILRPKLWNLEMCQLILPILVNDLLLQYDSSQDGANRYEYYIEISLKTLKLILTHFSPVIKTTLESLKETGKLIGKVDLSREDRVSKCLNCYKFLLEAQGIIMQRKANPKNSNGKLSFLYRDLAQSFLMFQASFQDIQDLSQRFRKSGNKIQPGASL